MKQVYIAYIKQDKENYLVYVPDIDQFTSGKTLFEAFHMGRDLLGAWFLEGKSIPEPSGHAMALLKTRKKADEEDFRFSEGEAVYIDIDFDVYRRKLNTTAVHKSVSLPAWLCDRAEAAGLSLSKVLQEALIEKLG